MALKNFFIMGMIVFFSSEVLAGDRFSAAVQHYRDKRYGTALQEFLLFVSESPNSHKMDKAIRYIWVVSQAIKKKESRLLLDVDDWQQTVKSAQKIIADRRSEANKMLKDLEALTVDVSKADSPLDPLRRAKLDPSHLDPSGMDEWVRLRADQYMTVIRQMLNKVIESSNPNAEDLHEAKGFFWFYQGDLELTIQEWEEVLKKRPNDTQLIARLRSVKEQWKEQKRQEEIEHYIQLGIGYFKTGRYKKARPCFKRALKLDPKNPEAARYYKLTRQSIKQAHKQQRIQNLMIKGRALEQKGQLLEAVQHWVDILSLEPQNAIARRSLERMRKRLIMQEKTAQVASVPDKSPRAKSAKPKKKEISHQALRQAEEAYSLGLIHYSDGNLPEAKKYFRQSVRLNPGMKKAVRALDQVTSEIDKTQKK